MIDKSLPMCVLQQKLKGSQIYYGASGMSLIYHPKPWETEIIHRSYDDSEEKKEEVWSEVFTLTDVNELE